MAYSYDAKTASSVKLKDIKDIARKAGVKTRYLTRYGDYIAKVSANIYAEELKKKQSGKLVLMTSITPTQLGEGKTVNAIGLAMALGKTSKKAICCIPQTAIGPLFGGKGKATGGGHSQVLPADITNLFLSGDAYRVATAQNLCVAYFDNKLFWKKETDIDKEKTTARRAVDLNDRALRNVAIGGGGKLHGVNRKTGFDTTSASECMAILSLAEDLKDLRARLGRMVVGFTKGNKPVTADDIKVAGAMAAILKDALNPNLVQTIEHTPCFIHTNPYADSLHGSGSVIAEKIALKLADYVVAEAGFGFDLGGEKFIDIKCRQSGESPACVVINCSVRALKVHSGDYALKGFVQPAEFKKENISAVDRGCTNLEKQVENIKMFGLPVVVCVNRFDTDSKKEIDCIIRRAEAMDVAGVAVSEAYKLGSGGCSDLAKVVTQVCKEKSKMRYLYPVDMTLESKIERITKSMYGASEVKYSDQAQESISRISKAKLDGMPVSISKAHLSLSNNSAKKGRPRGFKFPVDEVEVLAGAGYVLVKAEGMNSLQGMPKLPRGVQVDVDVKTGDIKGLI